MDLLWYPGRHAPFQPGLCGAIPARCASELCNGIGDALSRVHSALICLCDRSLPPIGRGVYSPAGSSLFPCEFPPAGGVPAFCACAGTRPGMDST